MTTYWAHDNEFLLVYWLNGHTRQPVAAPGVLETGLRVRIRELWSDPVFEEFEFGSSFSKRSDPDTGGVLHPDPLYVVQKRAVMHHVGFLIFCQDILDIKENFI